MPQGHLIGEDDRRGLKHTEKVASCLVMDARLKVASRQGFVETCSWSTTSTRGSSMASRLMHIMLKPYTLSQKSIFSLLRHTHAFAVNERAACGGLSQLAEKLNDGVQQGLCDQADKCCMIEKHAQRKIPAT